MARPPTPLLGLRIGCYTVVAQAPSTHYGHARWQVECTCGQRKITAAHNLLRTMTIKCPHAPPGHRVITPKQARILAAAEALGPRARAVLEDSTWKPLRALAEALEDDEP